MTGALLDATACPVSAKVSSGGTGLSAGVGESADTLQSGTGMASRAAPLFTGVANVPLVTAL